MRRAHDLDEQEKLIVEAWLKNFPQLEIAYHLKESFYDIYDAPTKEIALQRYFAPKSPGEEQDMRSFFHFSMLY